MKRIFAVLCVVLAVNMASYAIESPVTVTHKLVRYQSGPELATVQYALHVENSGKKPLTDLTLQVVRSQILRPPTPDFKIGTLSAGESRDLSLTIETPADIPRERVLRQPLLLAGKCRSHGKVLEFPVRSHAGGGAR
jgi:uncharacterized membrane protein